MDWSKTFLEYWDDSTRIESSKIGWLFVFQLINVFAGSHTAAVQIFERMNYPPGGLLRGPQPLEHKEDEIK